MTENDQKWQKSTVYILVHIWNHFFIFFHHLSLQISVCAFAHKYKSTKVLDYHFTVLIITKYESKGFFPVKNSQLQKKISAILTVKVYHLSEKKKKKLLPNRTIEKLEI